MKFDITFDIKVDWRSTIWGNRPKWWMWPLVVPYVAMCLLLVPFYLPAFLVIILFFVINWLDERVRAALWEQPVAPLKLWFWETSTFLIVRAVVPLAWYTRKLEWVLRKVRFEHKPEPKGD